MNGKHLLILSLVLTEVAAWISSPARVGDATPRTSSSSSRTPTSTTFGPTLFRRERFDVMMRKLSAASGSADGEPATTGSSSSEEESSSIDFADEEMKRIEDLNSQDDMEKALIESLPTMHPKFIMKLRQSLNDVSTSEPIRRVAEQLNTVLESRLQEGTNTLKELLNAGEIRKLDSLIGKASKDGRLDAAFFNVMTANLQDAAREEMEKDASEEGEDGAATRLQILQHVYTRCQEEVEKNMAPGTALLNKLLRTEQPQIRANLYQHYLTPQKNVISSPDGKEVELQGVQPILVSLKDFIDALAGAVEQIRTVETSGGTDRESAAIMVESCRQVAKEARIVLGESYGTDSDEVLTFEEGLQPVFRPDSADSKYMQGQT